MNTLKCQDCRKYDAIRSGKSKFAKHGWCAVRSVYPLKEAVGRVFPPGVKRVETAEEPAKPYVVEGAKVVPGCVQAVAK